MNQTYLIVFPGKQAALTFAPFPWAACLLLLARSVVAWRGCAEKVGPAGGPLTVIPVKQRVPRAIGERQQAQREWVKSCGRLLVF